MPSHLPSYRFVLDGRDISLGRDDSCDIVVTGIGVSRRHATISLHADGPFLRDSSSLGTRLNGTPVRVATLTSGDRLTIGIAEFLISVSPGDILFEQAEKPLFAPTDSPVVRIPNVAITIGRDGSNSVQVNHPLVSRFHARVVPGDNGEYLIADLRSTNGTYVNGRAVRQARLSEGAIVQIGPFRFTIDKGELVKADDANRITVEACKIVLRAKNRLLLDDVSISLDPGEFVVLLGPSGAGKSSLASTLAGRIPLQEGSLFYNGLPARDFFSAFSSRIGYVSQGNILHPELTVEETFREQSILRLPHDSVAIERHARIEEVMALLEIKHIARTRIGTLSGGEAKRVHFGIELLASPTLIFLDEPLAGLDTGLIRHFMELFRKICDRGHTILLTTHTLEQISLCDRVVFLNQGRLIFDGKPSETAEAFGAATLGEVYEIVKRGGMAQVQAKRVENDGGGLAPECLTRRARTRLVRSRSVSIVRQMGVLAPRYLKIFFRDLRNCTLVFAQGPLIAVLIGLVFKTEADFLPLSFYFCICISAIWFGGMNSVREIAREWPCFDREFRIGLSPAAFVSAKIFVFSLVAFAQSVLFVAALSSVFRGFGFSTSAVLLTATAAVSGAVLGLCISALSSSVNRAISWLPIVFIPQVFLSGILLPFDRMPTIGQLASHSTLSRPLFSLFKRVFVLEGAIWPAQEWHALILLCTGIIILLFAVVKWRRLT